MFHSARWKAYLHKLQDDDAAGDGSRPRSIYHIFHSQKIWFTQEQKNGHGESAEANLKRSDDLLEDCTNRVEALEETLANTPKPSEVLDWGQLW